MTEAKPKAHKVGEIVKAKSVTRPDGSVHTVNGDYVLDVVGTHLIDGEEVHVK